MNNLAEQNSSLNTNVYILAAGYRQQSQKPCSLWSFGNGESILGWQLGLFKSSYPHSCPVIAIGYNHESIIEEFPEQKFEYILGWQESGPLHTFLSLLKNENKTNIVMYGDTLFHSNTFTDFKALTADVVIVIDSKWRDRFSDRTQEDILLAETLQPKLGRVEYTACKFSLRYRDG